MTRYEMKSLQTVLLNWVLALAMTGCLEATSTTSSSKPVDSSLSGIKERGVLRWGADVVGGVPYVYEDPDNPGKYIGFEMDIVKGIAAHMGVRQEMVIKTWDSLIPELQRESFDFAMNGIEDTGDREQIVLFSEPYYVYSQQLTVRKDSQEINSLEDLRGKTVATLSGSAAEDILRTTPGVNVRINPEIIYSYADLENGRADAVLLDTPIAAAYGATNPKLKNVGDTFGQGTYVIAFRKEDIALRDAVNQALQDMKSTGELKAIYTKWRIMDSYQARVGVQ
jgi:polar amino acid transport system substrate-binding protein